MNERILVVDDEKAIADLVGIYLTKEGFDVQIAYSGADAAKAILEPVSYTHLTLPTNREV